MQAYIYDPSTLQLIATITGNDNDSIEQYYASIYDTDTTSLTYSPAFGATDGIKTGADFDQHCIVNNYTE
jgi:hypothetical protein